MIQPKQLAKYVGFTEGEVKKLCEEHDLDFEEMKYWYDGYSFHRETSVYSPNSVIEAVKSEEFGSHWTQTETYEALKFYIEMDEQGLKDAVVNMLGGARCTIDTGTFFAYISCAGNYIEIQELPSGKGYADIIYLPKKGANVPLLIIELK